MQTVLNNAPDIRLTLDKNGVITEIDLANEIATENIKDWLGTHWSETVSEKESKKLEHLLFKAADSTVSPYQQINQNLPSGLTIPMEYMAVRLGDNTGFIAVGRDVRVVANLQSRLSTIQKSVERNHWKLKEVESHYQKLFESSDEGMMIVDCDSYDISEANPAAIVTLALPSDLMKWNIVSHAIPADHKLLQTTLKRACKTGKSPCVLIHFGEQNIPMLVKASIIEFGNFENILVQLQAVQGSNQSMPYIKNFSFENFINRLPDAFVIVNKNGTILEGNSVFYELTKISSDDQILNRNLSEFIEYGKESLVKILSSDTAIRNLACNLINLEKKIFKVQISSVHIKDLHQYTIGVSIHVREQTEYSTDQININGLLGTKTDQIGKVSFRSLISSSIELVEKHYIETALVKTNGNRTAAAKMLGLSRQSLYVKLARFNSKKKSK